MELQSEAGACGAMHGALETGSLASTFTASQGLMLMIPPMYRIAGSMLPGVMHVAARTVGTHSISIFGDHSDVMACRQTGFAQLASASVQECMDLSAVAHLSAIKGMIPFQHFFDGFRTSHELQKIEVLDYEDLRQLVDWDMVKYFKDHALNSEHPTIRSTLQNPDTFFQSREACNSAYDALPEIVQEKMDAIKIIGDNTDQYAQAYFEYDSKKSGGVTKSHLRFGHEPIRSTYYVTMADFVACHKQSYMKNFDIVSEIKEGGTFLLNTDWDMAGLEEHLPNRAKRILAQRNIQFYTIDATAIAARIGLGNRTNTVLQSAFFKLSGILPLEDAVGYMKDAIIKTYSKKGEKIVNMNCAAVDAGLDNLVKIDVPAAWAQLQDQVEVIDPSLPAYIRDIQIPVNNQMGDRIPVSKFMPYADGVSPVETSKYERRGIATNVPMWIADNCIGCNMCSLVCPHAAIRPFLLTREEAEQAPEGCVTKTVRGKGFEN